MIAIPDGGDDGDAACEREVDEAREDLEHPPDPEAKPIIDAPDGNDTPLSHVRMSNDRRTRNQNRVLAVYRLALHAMDS